jgi:alkylation response protein AidB-like acyl-CoA dehydrogenase
MAYAFASGYQCAARTLTGDVVAASRVAFAATEAGGVHPRAILTRLEACADGFELSGEKAFVTLGAFAERFLVVASAGQREDGKNRLVVVSVDRRPGLRLEELPETPFVPEIPHARLLLDRVAVAPDEVLPGDGYRDYLKPFRTIEDAHVHAAFLGWLVGVARQSAWPRAMVARLAGRLVTLRALALAPPSDPAVHVALAGALADTATLLDDIEPLWSSVREDTRGRWQRDRALLRVAERARVARLEAAWRDLGS